MILIPRLTCGGDVWKTTVEHYKDKYECHVMTLAGAAALASLRRGARFELFFDEPGDVFQHS